MAGWDMSLATSASRTLIVLTSLWLLFPKPVAFAREQSEVSTELKELVAKIQKKLDRGENTKAELEGEIKELDSLLAKSKGEKSDEVANILYTEAMLYARVLGDPNKGEELAEQLNRDFPRTDPGRKAPELLATIRKQAEAKRIQSTLTVGSTFPDFSAKDLERNLRSTATQKGKVVLISFWATSSRSSVAEFPNLLRVYQKHHSRGLEMLGVSLDLDELTLSGFIMRYSIPWPQVCDGKDPNNKLATKCGVNSLPTTYLIDREGRIVGRDLRGEALEHAITASLATE